MSTHDPETIVNGFVSLKTTIESYEQTHNTDLTPLKMTVDALRNIVESIASGEIQPESTQPETASTLEAATAGPPTPGSTQGSLRAEVMVVPSPTETDATPV